MIRCRCPCHRRIIDAIAYGGVDPGDPAHAALACDLCRKIMHIDPYHSYLPPKPFEPPPPSDYDPTKDTGEG